VFASTAGSTRNIIGDRLPKISWSFFAKAKKSTPSKKGELNREMCY